MTADRRVLHPQKGRAALLVLCGVFVTAIGVGALTSGTTPLGAVVALLGLAGLASGLLRLLHPRSYALEIDGRGFRVHDVFGRVAHDVPWRDVRQLIPTPGNAPLRPGGEVRLAWLCFDDTPGAERRRQRNGIRIDGVLPDPYGIEVEELVEIMGDYSGRTAASSAA
jgi:hypothetical protein